MKYKISQYTKKYNVSIRTVWNWIYENKLKIERTQTNRILIIEDEDKQINDAVAIYARVSSSGNKDNLLRQRERLESYCSARGYKVIKVVEEIGSGLNDNRKKLESLLMDNSIKKIVV